MSSFKKLILIVLVASILIPMKAEASSEMDEWIEYAHWCAEKFDVPVEIVLAVIETESSFRQDAVSSSGNHIGLMQISKNGFSDTYVCGEPIKTIDTDLFNPFDNIYCGTMILRHYIDQSDSYHEALNRYNGVQGNKPSKYSNKVLALAYEIKQEG